MHTDQLSDSLAAPGAFDAPAPSTASPRARTTRVLATIGIALAACALVVLVHANLVLFAEWRDAHAAYFSTKAPWGTPEYQALDEAYVRATDACGFRAVGGFAAAFVSLTLGVAAAARKGGRRAALAIGLAVAIVPLAIRLTQAL